MLRWFFNPYVQILFNVLLVTAAELCFKKGANAFAPDEIDSSALSWEGLLSGWTWVGIVALICSLVSWLNALRSVPLNIAYSLAGLVHVCLPLACWIFLGEHINAQRWGGILFVLIGIWIIAKPLIRLEERL